MWANQSHQATAAAIATGISDSFLDHLFFVEAHRHAPPITIVKAGSAINNLGKSSLDGGDLLSFASKSDQALLWGMLDAVTKHWSPASLKLEMIGLRADGTTGQFNAEAILAPLGGSATKSRWLGYLHFTDETPSERSVTAFNLLELYPPRHRTLTA